MVGPLNGSPGSRLEGVAFLYPGQGTQRVGMGTSFWRTSPTGMSVFVRASNLVGLDFMQGCARGPMEWLTATERAQPAIFTCNASAHELLDEQGITPDFVAGHSVGELTALWAAGVMSFDDALQLAARRARLMASVSRVGTMAAVVGVSEQTVVECCDQSRYRGPVVIALYNGPGRYVVSGAKPAVEECGLRLQTAGAKVVPLSTSNAFHSPLMEEVADTWADVVRDAPMMAPSIPIVVNTTGQVAHAVEDIRRAVTDQLTTPVRWHETITTLVRAGASAMIECGDSKTLSTFNRVIAPLIPTATMADPRSVRRMMATHAPPVDRSTGVR